MPTSWHFVRPCWHFARATLTFHTLFAHVDASPSMPVVMFYPVRSSWRFARYTPPPPPPLTFPAAVLTFCTPVVDTLPPSPPSFSRVDLSPGWVDVSPARDDTSPTLPPYPPLPPHPARPCWRTAPPLPRCPQKLEEVVRVTLLTAGVMPDTPVYKACAFRLYQLTKSFVKVRYGPRCVGGAVAPGAGALAVGSVLRGTILNYVIFIGHYRGQLIKARSTSAT